MYEETDRDYARRELEEKKLVQFLQELYDHKFFGIFAIWRNDRRYFDLRLLVGFMKELEEVPSTIKQYGDEILNTNTVWFFSGEVLIGIDDGWIPPLHLKRIGAIRNVKSI